MRGLMLSVVLVATLACSALANETPMKVSDLKAKFEQMATADDRINVNSIVPDGDMAAETAEEAPRSNADLEALTAAAKLEGPQMTASLLAWISAQCETVVEEMEAIVEQNTDGSSFSIVNYLRYLRLYDALKVVADKGTNLYPELKWVARKARAFALVYKSALSIVHDYLQDLDVLLRRIEDKEPKGKQTSPKQDWVNLYKTIKYIAIYSPQQTDVAEAARDLLKYSPDHTDARRRSMRFKLGIHAFSR